MKAHYRGQFINGAVFDASREGEAATFAVTRVIPGWTEALQKMKVGDKWQLFIPPELAYGPAGWGDDIPPNAALIFEIELRRRGVGRGAAYRLLRSPPLDGEG